MVTQADIDTLSQAIYSGVKKVKFKDRETEYRDLSEMKATLSDMKAELANTPREHYRYVSYSRDYQN